MSDDPQGPLRVLQVIGKMDRAGAETALMNWYRNQDRNDIQFDFLVHTDEPGAFDDEIRSLGGRIYTVPAFNGFNGMQYRKAVRDLLADHPEWSVVHGHIGSTASRYLREARAAGRVAVAHSHNTHGPLSPRELVYRFLTAPVKTQAQDFIGCSDQAGLDRFGEVVVAGPRYHTLANGIDVTAYAVNQAMHDAAKARFGWDGRCVVGHVGRFTPQKNHGFLLEAFASFKQAIPEALLVLVGEGELEDEVRKRAQELGVDDDTVFFGLTDDVASVLAAFDLFVFPSLFEGLPVACVEAQAAGVPLIISDGVPAQTMIASAVRQIPLASGPEGWAKAMEEAVKAGPNWDNGPNEVRAAGFDAVESASWLADHYHKLVEMNEDGTL